MTQLGWFAYCDRCGRRRSDTLLDKIGSHWFCTDVDDCRRYCSGLPEPAECNCEFDPDPEDPSESTKETAWHFKRECIACGHEWFGLHCPHDGAQNPCPHCGEFPEPVK